MDQTSRTIAHPAPHPDACPPAISCGQLSRPSHTGPWSHLNLSSVLAGHAGDWRAGQTDWQGQRLNQPLIAFESAKHAGSVGKNLSLVNLSSSRVRVLALKKAEESDEINNFAWSNWMARRTRCAGCLCGPGGGGPRSQWTGATRRRGNYHGWKIAGRFHTLSTAHICRQIDGSAKPVASVSLA